MFNFSVGCTPDAGVVPVPRCRHGRGSGGAPAALPHGLGGRLVHGPAAAVLLRQPAALLLTDPRHAAESNLVIYFQ